MQNQEQENAYYPSPQQGQFQVNENKSDLLDQIRPEEVIEQIKQRLMGKEFDTVKGVWVPNPALKNISLTEVGASAITNLIFPASTRNVAISNLNNEEIKNRLLSLVRTAMKMCLDNWEIYGIESISQLYFVKEVVYTNTLVALKQPENEGIRRLLNSVISENRSVSTYGEEKKSLLGVFRRK